MIIRSFERRAAGGFWPNQGKNAEFCHSDTFGMGRFLWNLFKWHNYTEAPPGQLVLVGVSDSSNSSDSEDRDTINGG